MDLTTFDLTTFIDTAIELLAVPSTGDRPDQLRRALDLTVDFVGPGFVVDRFESRGMPSALLRLGINADALPTADGVPARKRATPILRPPARSTRRVKQAIAEWYVLDMLEKSWGGLVEHTEQGFNIGKPPYGYQVAVEKRPVPAKAALGKVKRRLVRDPVPGGVVTQIYCGGTASGCRMTRSRTG